MSSLLVINGHPRPDSLCDTAEEVYAAEARTQGLKVEVLRLRDLDFDPNLRYPLDQSGTAMEEVLLKAQERIGAAQHITLIYPNWWGTFPALLKGFIDRTLTPGFAFKYRRGTSLPIQLLKGKTASLIIPMDGPGWWYRVMMGAGGDKAMKHSTLGFCGIRVTRTLHLGNLRGVGRTPVEHHLKRVTTVAHRDARRLGKHGV